MASISRSQGYSLAAGKEELALVAFEAFLRDHLSVVAERITDQTENFEFGDFRLSWGVTIECKGQPIDPTKYPKNFIEVFEDTTAGKKGIHSGGFELLVASLQMTGADLAAARVLDYRYNPPTVAPLGTLTHLSVSIHTFVRATAVAYVNSQKNIVGIYPSRLLIEEVRTAIRGSGLMRARGNSNADTFSVFVPYPALLWRRVGQKYESIGVGVGPDPEGDARRLLRLDSGK